MYAHQWDLISHNTCRVLCIARKVMNILCTFASIPDDLCQTAFWENVKHRERSRIICNKNQCINRNHIGKTNSFQATPAMMAGQPPRILFVLFSCHKLRPFELLAACNGIVFFFFSKKNFKGFKHHFQIYFKLKKQDFKLI